MARVLITGVTGQDGSYLLDRLAPDADEVVGFVRPGDPAAQGLEAAFPTLTLVEVDLADPASVAREVAAIGADEFFHLAGISSVAQSWQDPLGTATITGVSAMAAMNAAVEAVPACRVVLASSGEIFAGGGSGLYSEASPMAPTNPYAAAKAFAHHSAHVLRAAGSHVAVTILFNHESPRRPHAFVTRKITAGAARIARGLDDVIELGNLDARRDWGWAPDYVDAMIRAARHETPEDFVVATGHTQSVRDFAVAALTAAGVDDQESRLRVNPAFLRANDAPELAGDASKARDVLGWETTRTFDEVVAAMVDADLAELDAAS